MTEPPIRTDDVLRDEPSAHGHAVVVPLARSTEAEARSTEEIWRNLRARVHAYLRSQVRDPEDCDDLLQEVFLRVHRHLDSLRDDVVVDAWVYRIVRNTITDRARARSVRVEGNRTVSFDELPTPPALAPEVEAIEERRFRTELAACLLPLVACLSPEQRQAFELVELRGLTQREAAARVGISVTGMKSRTQRAKRRLREVIEACCGLEFDAFGAVLDCQPGACSPDAQPVEICTDAGEGPGSCGTACQVSRPDPASAPNSPTS